MKGKRKFLKRMLGMGLALLLCIIGFSASVAAQAATADTYSDTESVTWEYDEVTKTLTISGEGAMPDYASTTAVPWYSFRKEIEKVIIEDGVTSISDYAFLYCESLAEVTLPNSVTSIGEQAFYFCEGLTEITIPNSVSSIGNYAFYNCNGLTEITMPDSLTSIGDYTFSYCDSLTKITIPDSVTSIGNNAFSYCEGLTEIMIPDGVTSIGNNAFYYCRSLTEITIPNSVTSIEASTFGGCRSLTEITIPDGVTSIGNNAFSYCEGLTEITIPDGVTSIGDNAFTNCSSLTEITIPDGVTSIGRYAFYCCRALTEITIPDSVTSIGDYVFYYCNNLTTVNLGCNWKSDIDSGRFYVATNKESVNYSHVLAEGEDTCYCGEINMSGNFSWKYDEATKTLTISGKGKMPDYSTTTDVPWYSFREDIEKVIIEDGVTSISNYAFYLCAGLTEVTIPDSVTSIGNSVFYNCSSLTEITIPDSVTSIGGNAFKGCSSLTEITIPDGVTSIASYLFSGCSSLTEITIPDSVTDISYYAFDGCKSLTEITIPDGVTSIANGAFSGCRSLTDIAIPDGVTSINYGLFSGCSSLTEITIPDGVTSISDHAFNDCSSLTEITIPDSVMSIGVQAFYHCTALKEITIPNGVTSIGKSTFSGCSSLTEIAIPDSVTSIGNDAFYDCSSLAEITIPDGVTSIGNYVFYGCSSLTEIAIPGSVTSIGDYAFRGCSSLKEITIPDGVTSIGDYAFYSCSSLTEITISNSVTSIGKYAFNGSRKSITLHLGCNWKSDIDSGNFYGVTNIETVNYRHIGDTSFAINDTDKSITSTCEACGMIFGTVTLLDPDADAKIMYDGTSKTTKYEGEIPGETPVITYTGVTATNGEAVKAGTYTATMTVGGQKVSVQFVIEKVEWAPNAPQKTMTVPYTLTKVKDVALPGNWAWQKSYTDLDLTVGEVTVATAVYNGADKGNYKNEAVLIEITRSACVHEGGVATCVEKATCDVCGEQYGLLDSTNHGEEEVCNQSEATCTVNGYTGDTCCEDCGAVLEQGEAIEAKGHVGGTATCVEKATCDVCGEKYGDLDSANHGEEVVKNQTEATCTADGYTGDACCKDCDAVLVEGEVIVAKGHVGGTATCVEQATCEVCGEKYGEVDATNHGEEELCNQSEATCTTDGYTGDTCCKDCGTVLVAGEVIAAKGHIGGTATCIEKAICDVCGKEYNEVDNTNHGDKELRNQTDATCVVDGYTGDTYCKDCDAVLVAGEVIAAKGHVGGIATCVEKATCDVCGEKYGEVDATNHGDEVVCNQSEATCTEDGYTGDTCCEDCDAVLVEGEAIAAKGHIGGTATCIEKAICDVCGEQYGALDTANHGEEEVCNQSEATCTVNGYTGDTCCVDCGAVLEQGEAIEAKGHVGGTATCTEKAICDVCGKEYNEVDNTNHGDKELRNQTDATCVADGYTGDTYCKDCDAVLVEGEAIAAKGHMGGTSTCVEKATCDVCGEKYGEVNATNHGDEVVCNQTEVTCTEDGYTGDTCCEDCGTVLATGKVIAHEGHDYESEVTKEPTATETGVCTYTCTKCGDTYTEEIDKLPASTCGITAEVTYASHWGNGGQVEITLTNEAESLLDGWNIELDLNIDAKLTNTWGDGYVTSFEDGHVCITNQSWVTSFESGTTKKVYLQYEGTLPDLVTCTQGEDVLVASINYLNHWGNGGQIEICLENTGDTFTNGWGTELDINLIGEMTGTWGEGYVTSFEEGHIIIENQSWATWFVAGTVKSIYLQYEGTLQIVASNVTIQ